MRITEISIPFEIDPTKEPVFDAEVEHYGDDVAPGACRGIQIAIKPPLIEGGRPVLTVMAVFAVNPDRPKQKRRFLILMPRAIVGIGDSKLTYLASYLDGPSTFSLYEVHE